MDEESEDEVFDVREAKEVFLYMHRNFRASRNLRAHWYINHLYKKIKIDEGVLDDESEYSKEMVVAGIIPIDGDGSEVVMGEEFIVTNNTKVTYISRYYRMVFVIDLSPSVIVADDESDCCLSERLLDALKNSIRSAVKEFTIPGSTTRFKPEIYISICAFIPFLKFEHENTLVQRMLLTAETVDNVIQKVDEKYTLLFRRLFEFAKPILRQWGKLRRRHKNNKFDSFCENASVTDETTDSSKQSSESNESVRSDVLTKHEYLRRVYGNNSVVGEVKSTSYCEKGIWACAASAVSDTPTSFAGDAGYILPEWSLIFMLRLGLISIQMLPENTQSNLVVISDSVSGMPDEKALQLVLTQLRSFTIALSVIQLQRRACTEPVFGHVGSCQLFHFLTMATFGTYLPRKRRAAVQSAHSSRRRYYQDFDEVVDESDENMNVFHRSLICWSFQNALHDNEYLLDTFLSINEEFVALQKRDLERHRRFLTTYEATLNQLIYVRLREGFTLKSTIFNKKRTNAVFTLRLAFRPLVFIDYIISSPWPTSRDMRQEMQVEVVIEAPYNELKDLLAESQFLDPERLNLLKSVIDGIIEADRLLLHIHSYNTRECYYSIPAGVNTEYSLFPSYDWVRRKMPQICIARGEENTTKNFIGFWREMLGVNDHNWQKWVHTQTERLLVKVPEIPFNMFTTDKCLEFRCELSYAAVREVLKETASFCLVDNQTYVSIIYERATDKLPSFFFLRKLCTEGPSVLIKTAFLGGISSSARKEVVQRLRDDLQLLKFNITLSDEENDKQYKINELHKRNPDVYPSASILYQVRKANVCGVIRRPLERMLVKYNQVPLDLRTIVRVQETRMKDVDEDEVKLITIHNAISKCLVVRRSIILMSDFKEGAAFHARKLTDFVMNVIMQKRIKKEKFKPSWTTNNIVSLIRQFKSEDEFYIEQFIMFPATSVVGTDRNSEFLKAEKHEKRRKKKKAYYEPNEAPDCESTNAMAIISEFWGEPAGAEATGKTDENTLDQRQLDDVNFASTIFTLDRIIRAASRRPENMSTYTTKINDEDDEEVKFMRNSEFCRNTTINVMANKNFENEDKCVVTAKKLSPYVTLFSNMFNVANLFAHCQRQYINIPHFVKDDENIAHCNYLLLQAIHMHLTEMCEMTWPVHPTENEHILKELTRTLSEKQKFANIPLRLFIKYVSPWMVGAIIVPERNTEFSLDREGIPMFVLTCHETQLAYCAAHNSYTPERIVKTQICDLPNEWRTETRANWASSNAQSPENTHNFAKFVMYVEEEILSRTRMAAFYEAAQRGLSVDDERVTEISMDSDYVEFEMESVADALQFVCEHVKNNDYSHKRSRICSQNSNMQQLFEKTLFEYFLPVPGSENFFYLNPEPIKKEKKKTSKIEFIRSKIEGPERGSEDDDSTDSLTCHGFKKFTCDIEKQPIFIQFSCTVRFRQEDTMETFPINFLPSCIHQLLEKCPDIAEGEIELGNLYVAMELLVLTSNTMTSRTKTRSKGSSSNRRRHNSSDYYKNLTLKHDRQRNDDSECTVNFQTTADSFSYLPKRERRIILELVKNVNIILELEQILVETRSKILTREAINRLIVYVRNACLSVTRVGFMEEREKTLSLVIKNEHSRKRFLNVLDGTKCSYLKLLRFDNSNIFCIRSVHNIEIYKKQKMAERMAKMRPGTILEREKPRMDQLKDFWVVIIVDENFIKLYCCQRYERLHTAAIDELWRTVRQKLRNLNQALLLTRMYETRECDQLLIGFDEPLETFSEDSSTKSSPMKTIRRRINSNMPLNETVRYEFAPGYFACNLQHELWFRVPQRLREISARQKRASLAYAFERLLFCLTKYGVRNVPNLFVYRDAKALPVSYIQLHMSVESYEQSIKNTKIELKKKHLALVEKRLENDLCMTMFGIVPQTTEIVNRFKNALQKRLDQDLLAELLRGYTHNREQSLMASEVEFFQPIDQGPTGNTFFSIPSIFGDYLFPLLHYIRQHIETLNYIAPAKIKDDNSTKTLVSTKAIIQLKPGQPNRQIKFQPHKPFVGEIPVKYDKSSFYMYIKLPTAGVTKVGLALIEFRMVAPDGQVIGTFEQPKMNEASHELLVPNVPDDKSTVYRDIIKVQACESPNDIKDTRTISGFLEVVVWEQGDIELAKINELIVELIEMGMYDVITEFGYLNTHLIETASITGIGMFNRSSEIFVDSEINQGLTMSQKNDSSTSVTNSCDGSNRPSISGEMRRSIVHGGSIDLSSSKSQFSKIGSAARDIGGAIDRHEIQVQKPDYIQRKTAISTMKWLDFVASKSGETNTVVKDTIRFECQHAILLPLFEIRNRVECCLGGQSGIHENVYLCKLTKQASEPAQHIPLRESTLSIYGNVPDTRFEVVTTDPFVKMDADIGVDETEGSPNEFLIVSKVKNIFEGYGDNMFRTKNEVSDLEMLFSNHLHSKYEPFIETKMYSPRQRIMFAMMKGELMIVYYYNFHPNILKEVKTIVHKIAGLHNARTRLLREIGLHKMGITHLSPFHTTPQSEYDFEMLIWTDPLQLVGKEFPSDTFSIPSYLDSPEYSNIFFRMYRQLDLQFTMGRSSCVFVSECVPTNHHEQMMRWRMYLRNKLDIIRRITNVHVELMKGNGSVKEEDLLLFLRPPKVARRIDSTVKRPTIDETEDNETCSLTERTSKRASIYGEQSSIRSAVVDESDIFKYKGTFIKKQLPKRESAAVLNHEIRTPLFLMNKWRKEAVRCGGEYENEFLRQCNIRLQMKDLLEGLECRMEQDKKEQTTVVENFMNFPPTKFENYPSKANIPGAASCPSIITTDSCYPSSIPIINYIPDTDDIPHTTPIQSSSDSSDSGMTGEDPFQYATWKKTKEHKSVRRRTESQRHINIDDLDVTHTDIPIHRKMSPRTPIGSPVNFMSERPSSPDSSNSIASIPVAKPVESSGPIEKVLSVASKLARRFRKHTEKDVIVEKGEDLAQSSNAELVYEEPFIGIEPIHEEPLVNPMLYHHADDFTKFFTKTYGFKLLEVSCLSRRSMGLNRYSTTSKNVTDEAPYLVFYKPFDGGAIFAELKYELPDYVVSTYIYQRAKHSTVDYYMIEKMNQLYEKETELLKNEVERLKSLFNFSRFNYEYHQRAIAKHLVSLRDENKSIFGNRLNFFEIIECIENYYRYADIRTKNFTATKYMFITKDRSTDICKVQNRDNVLITIQKEVDTDVFFNENNSIVVDQAIIQVQDTYDGETGDPITDINVIPCLPELGKPVNKLMPACRLRIYNQDMGEEEITKEKLRELHSEYPTVNIKKEMWDFVERRTPENVTAWTDNIIRNSVTKFCREECEKIKIPEEKSENSVI